jgi:hypothetical protein
VTPSSFHSPRLLEPWTRSVYEPAGNVVKRRYSPIGVDRVPRIVQRFEHVAIPITFRVHVAQRGELEREHVRNRSLECERAGTANFQSH